FFSSRRRHTRFSRDWSSDVCSSDLPSCLRLDEQGQSQRVLLRELAIGDRLLIPPGAQLPADGRIIAGQSSIDESLLTGEYLPLARGEGDQVTAGTLNVEGPLTVQVEALGSDTRL